MGERGLELWVQEPSCPNSPLQSQCKVKRWQGSIPKCHHQESRCTEGLKEVSEWGVFLGTQACSDLQLTPWFQDSWGDHWGSRGNKVRQRGLQLPHLSMYWEEHREGKTDTKEQNPKAASGFGLGLWNFAIKQSLSLSHIYSISQARLLNKPRRLLWLRRGWNQLHQSFSSGTHRREDKCFLAQTNRKL